jgi:hypothetical protein
MATKIPGNFMSRDAGITTALIALSNSTAGRKLSMPDMSPARSVIPEGFGRQWNKVLHDYAGSLLFRVITTM